MFALKLALNRHDSWFCVSYLKEPQFYLNIQGAEVNYTIFGDKDSMIQFIYIMACNMKMMYIISHCHWYPDWNKNFQEVISSLKRCIKCARDINTRISFIIKIGGH